MAAIERQLAEIGLLFGRPRGVTATVVGEYSRFPHQSDHLVHQLRGVTTSGVTTSSHDRMFRRRASATDSPREVTPSLM